ncbi:MAG: hypothetical protein AB8D52_02550 [Gammaproteobacteria bacterium]
MSISFKDATELLLDLEELETTNNKSSDQTTSENFNKKSPTPTAGQLVSEKANNISALSLDHCGSQELIHCYQLALDFGVPTARRALAIYQSRVALVKNSDEVKIDTDKVQISPDQEKLPGF